MEEYIKEVIETMETLKTGNNIGEVRWFFENVAMPLALFRMPAEVVSGIENDPLYAFRIFDKMTRGRNVVNGYTFTPDMTYTGRPEEDRMAVIVMPEPHVIGHSYVLLMFTDAEYDYPGYFLIIKGANDSLHLLTYRADGKSINLGNINDPEEAAIIAYEIYKASREQGKKWAEENPNGTFEDIRKLDPK